VLPADESAKGERRGRIVALNTMVSTLADGKRLVFHNSGALLTRPDGSISPDIMPDFLHLTPRATSSWPMGCVPISRN
jgi:hypothetical protein